MSEDSIPKYVGIKIEGSKIIDEGFVDEFHILSFYEINEYLDYFFLKYSGKKENFLRFVENTLAEFHYRTLL